MNIIKITVENYKNQSRYFFEKNAHKIYFTQREVDILKASTYCSTYEDIANTLGLSKRTVEMYFKPIKYKLSCSRKKEVMQCILDSNFIDQISAIESALHSTGLN